MIARQVFGLLFVLHFVNINLEYLQMDKNIDKVMHAYNSNVLEQIRVTSYRHLSLRSNTPE